MAVGVAVAVAEVTAVALAVWVAEVTAVALAVGVAEETAAEFQSILHRFIVLTMSSSRSKYSRTHSWMADGWQVDGRRMAGGWQADGRRMAGG